MMAAAALAIFLGAANAPVAAQADRDAARMDGAPGVTQGLPGWDDASASAGCLAMAASLTSYFGAALDSGQVRADGEFWSWRLQSLAPEDAVRIEYWEAAHEWLVDELRARDDAAARDFLQLYRGQCSVARAMAQSEIMWEAMR